MNSNNVNFFSQRICIASSNVIVLLSEGNGIVA